MRVPLTPLDFYRRSRRWFGSKTAVVDGDRREDFAGFGARVERLAGALAAGGLRPREVVSVLAPNTHHLLEAFYGVPLAGGVVHPVNPRRPALEIAERINDAGSRTLLFHADAAGEVREVLGNLKAIERLVVLEGDPGGLDFPALPYQALLDSAAPSSIDLADLDEDAPCALFDTSGGASRPRGVLLSHRTLALHALYAALAIGLREDDVSLCSVPFSYMNGGGNPQANVAVGATSVLARRNDPEALLRLIASERVTVWITAPAVLTRVLRAPAPEGGPSLRLILLGGAPVSEATIAAAEERFSARCAQVYGLTETSPFVTAALAPSTVPAEERRAFQATGGLPILGVEVAVVGEDGREVPWDGVATGEVRVRGNGVMTGYHHEPERTGAALRGGWLRTGDLAAVGRDGTLRIKGRREDAVRVDGRTVPAREVEAALASHPAVDECAVIAAPDPERGEAPVALVVRRRGSAANEDELLAHCRQRLARFKVPARIEFVSALPRSEGGEVVRSELRVFGYAKP